MKVHALVADLETARRAVAAGATVVQLRVKGPTDEIVERGAGFTELGVTFVVNDDVDAALALGAEGVHLGQGDPGASRARARGLLLGRSVTTLEEAQAADADYLGAGPGLGDPVEGGCGSAAGPGRGSVRSAPPPGCPWSRSGASTLRTPASASLQVLPAWRRSVRRSIRT